MQENGNNEKKMHDSMHTEIPSPDLNSLREYLSFFIGQLISLLGSSIVQFVIILWITFETKSAFYLGLSSFLGFGTTIALTPVAGVYVDRWNRKLTIGLADFLQALATIGLIFLFLINQASIWAVITMLVIRGAMQAFHTPATQAITPLLVPKDQLGRITSMSYLLSGIIYIIGPVIAAILLNYWTISQMLWIDAITFIIALIPLLFIKIPPVTHLRKKRQQHFSEEFKEGVLFIKKKKGLLPLLFSFTSVNFFATPLGILLPVIIILIQGRTSEELAFAMALQQIGFVLASSLMGITGGFRNNAWGVAMGLVAMYIAMILIALAPTNMFFLLLLGMLITGIALPIANISSQTIWLSVVEPQIQGRVFSVRRTIAQVTVPISMLFAGIFADIIGVRKFLVYVAVIGLIIHIYILIGTGMLQVEKTVNQRNLEYT